MATQVIASANLIYGRVMQIRPPLALRAATLGLAAGLLLSALYLVVRACLDAGADCVTGAGEDCQLQRQLAQEVLRLQVLFVIALTAVAAGLLLLARKRPAPR